VGCDTRRNRNSFAPWTCRAGRDEKEILISRYIQVDARAECVSRQKKWDENVYCGMRMENRAVTFPQTQTILSGVNVPNVRLDDVQAILNMRDAWRYLMNP